MGVLALLLTGAALAAPAANAPVHWPSVHSRVPRDPAIEARIDRVLKRMSVEEKVGQTIQGDIPQSLRTRSASISSGPFSRGGTALRTMTTRRPPPTG